jgi:Tol biopolymer transport system component
MRSRRACALWLLPLGCALLSGCDTVVWLPDSSGIIFPEKEGTRLVRYDLATKKRTSLLPGKTFKSLWPGISADGKKLAIGELTVSTQRGLKERTRRLRIVIYSVDGKELSRSKIHLRKDQLPEAAESTKDTTEDVLLDWSGPPDKMLIGWGPFGIYDVKKDTIQDIDAEPFGTLPVRPDGKGFVAVSGIAKGAHLVLYDWNGNRKKLDLPFIGPGDFREETDLALAYWSKANLQLTTPKSVITFDTDKGKASSKRLPMAARAAGETIKWAHAFPGGETYMCCVEGPVAKTWLEWHHPRKKQVKTLTAPNECKFNDMQLFPSPDGKSLALSCETAKEQKRILIIDATGKTGHNIAIED